MIQLRAPTTPTDAPEAQPATSKSLTAYLLLTLTLPAAATLTVLLISECDKGSTNNKAIKICNGTSAALGLAGYSLEFNINGSSMPGAVILLAGTQQSDDVSIVADHDAAPQSSSQVTPAGAWLTTAASVRSRPRRSTSLTAQYDLLEALNEGQVWRRRAGRETDCSPRLPFPQHLRCPPRHRPPGMPHHQLDHRSARHCDRRSVRQRHTGVAQQRSQRAHIAASQGGRQLLQVEIHPHRVSPGPQGGLQCAVGREARLRASPGVGCFVQALLAAASVPVNSNALPGLGGKTGEGVTFKVYHSAGRRTKADG